MNQDQFEREALVEAVDRLARNAFEKRNAVLDLATKLRQAIRDMLALDSEISDLQDAACDWHERAQHKIGKIKQ